MRVILIIMSFKDIIKSDAINTILNQDEVAEAITYTPLDQDAKTIKAIVVREPIEPGSEDQGRILQKQAEIHIANDADEGVSSVNISGDMVSFPVRTGEDAVDWAVIKIVKKDLGLWQLKVQR